MRATLTFLDLSPAFNGERGWIWITELDAIDPISVGQFQVAQKDFTAEDGTVFCYAFPSSEPMMIDPPGLPN